MQSMINSLEIKQLRKKVDRINKHLGLKKNDHKEELRNIEYCVSNGKEYEIKQEDYMIKVFCAWCGKFMYEKEGTGGDSHGICDECLKKELASL